MQQKPASPVPFGKARRGEAHPEGPDRTEAKRIYVRTVYALNPGIPHYPDFPGGWA